MNKIINTTLFGLAMCAVISPINSYAAAVTNNFNYRQKVIGITGIMDQVGSGLQYQITRAEFSKMLANASTYKDSLPNTSSAPVYADVPASNTYAASIRLAADNGWMTGYLGGNFKPDQGITLKDAAKGVMALLGYANSDFTGNVSNGRMTMFTSLELNKYINRYDNEVLTREDCINLFYNLLTTKMKDGGKTYGTVIGCEITSDGEINPMALADSSLSEPKVVRKGRSVGDYVPFNVQEANIFINGEPATYNELKGEASNNYVVLYYNKASKTIWAYVEDDDSEIGTTVRKGEITHIYYSSTDIMTPTYIVLEDDDEIKYKLNSSEIQFAFSIYGSLRIGDEVTLICEKTSNSGDTGSYTIIDYVED